MSRLLRMAIFLSIVYLQGCKHDDAILRIAHYDTISLIDYPTGSDAKKIFDKHEEEGWFFIPQISSLREKDEVWLALRVYSRNPPLSYELTHLEVSFPNSEVVEIEDLVLEDLTWDIAPAGWYYQFIVVKSYSYSSVENAGVKSAMMNVKVAAMGREVSKEFELIIDKISYSGW